MVTKKENHFLTAVRNALKQFTDPEALGMHSPLAKPYFLGEFLNRVEHPETIIGQGRALQNLLFQAAVKQWPESVPSSRDELYRTVMQEQAEMGNGGPCLLFLILELRYFRSYYPPRTQPTTVGAIYDHLLLSESAFFRYLSRAIEDLVINLTTLVRPNLRLEQPKLSTPLVGRDELLANSLQDLLQGRSVAFSGMGGIGKTSLATAVANSWPSEAAFWYTFRPGLNDDLASLLFALGHFLQSWGRFNLWLQLIAKDNAINDAQQALGFLHEDITHPESPIFLLCFDEVDLLHTGRSQPRHGVHKQLLELLEGMRHIAPLLLVGQRALVDTTTHYALQPLTVQDTALIFTQGGCFISDSIYEKVHRLTEGNPRLIELYLTLLPNEQEQSMISFRRQSAIKPLFHRLWKRLTQDEKQLLANLSVFRSYAPQDVWQETNGYQDLQRRQLLKKDSYGGITLLPLFRDLIYDELTSDQRSSFHQQAAIIRATRGQHTSAAYHFVKSGDIETAVQLWFAHQEREIALGGAGAAYTIFTPLRPGKLPPPTANLLKTIQNRLHLRYGEAEKVLADIDDYSWHLEDGLSPQLQAQGLQQLAEAHLHLGQYDTAMTRYDDALGFLGKLSRQMVSLYANGRGRVWLHQSHFQAAEQEARLAQFEVEHFQLKLKMARGQLKEVQEIGNAALELALTIGDEGKVALVHFYIASATGNLGDIPTAQHHAKQLFAICERTGDRLLLENMRAELAGFYLNVGRFAEAIEPAEQALHFFEKVKNDLRLPYIYSNLAEAYYEVGQLEKAEQYAFKARHSENPRVQPYICYTLGLIYQAKKNPQAAEEIFQFGLQAADQTEDQFIAAYLHRTYGTFLAQINRSQEGMFHLQTSLHLFTEIDIPHEIEKTQQAIDAC